MGETPAGQRIFDGQHLRCTLFGAGVGLFASFDNFVGRKSGFGDCAPSRKVMAAGLRQVVIQTAANDWYLNAELDDLLGALRQLGGGEPSKALGFSMGAYGALLCAEALGTREMYLISPRLPRPMGWTGRARVHCPDEFLAPSWQDRLVEAAARPVRALVLHDPQKYDDRMTARWLENTHLQVTTFGIAFGGHPCASYINEANRFGAMQDILLAGEVRTQDLARLKRSARAKSALYQAKLAEYLAARKARSAP